MKRVRMFLDAYGDDFGLRTDRGIVEAAFDLAERERDKTERLAGGGTEPWVTLLSRREELDLKRLWIDQQLEM